MLQSLVLVPIFTFLLSLAIFVYTHFLADDSHIYISSPHFCSIFLLGYIIGIANLCSKLMYSLPSNLLFSSPNLSNEKALFPVNWTKILKSSCDLFHEYPMFIWVKKILFTESLKYLKLRFWRLLTNSAATTLTQLTIISWLAYFQSLLSGLPLSIPWGNPVSSSY